jgi:biopolymer transport protein ExbD
MPLKTSMDELPTLNLTSMIDVTFLLIVFFMLGTQFIDPERDIGLAIPEVKEAGPMSSAPAKKVVNVFADGHLTMGGDTVTLGELKQRLAAAREQYAALGVLVRGDAQASFQKVAEVLNACQQAGIGELAISVRLASTAKVPR